MYEKQNICFFKPNKAFPNLNIQISNVNLEAVDKFVLLGITLDQNLSLKVHLDKVSNKLSKLCGILNAQRSQNITMRVVCGLGDVPRVTSGLSVPRGQNGVNADLPLMVFIYLIIFPVSVRPPEQLVPSKE